MMILDLRFQIFDLPDLFDLSLSIGNYWIGTSIRKKMHRHSRQAGDS